MKRKLWSTTGVLVFTHGEHKYSFGTGAFGQAAGAKLETQDIPVQFLINNPPEDAVGVPYTGVIVRLPKATDTVLTYGLGAGAKHHTIELRFACEVGSIAYKCLDPDAPELDIPKETNLNLDLKEKIMNVRFRIHPDDPIRPYIQGHNWPNIPSCEAGKVVNSQTQRLLEVKVWNLFLPYPPALESQVLSVGKMFAKKGTGTQLKQYMYRGRPQ